MEDKVQSFDCGDEDLNDFILNDALLYYKARLSTSYVVENSKTGDAYASALPFYYNQGFLPLSKEDEGASTRLLYFDLQQL